MKRPARGLTATLYVAESGVDAPSLVFLPGMGGTTRYWQGRLAVLERTHHIFLVDPLGFGQSPKPRTQYTAVRHVDALHHTLSRRAPFTLIGHSMGAVLSVAYAARYPDQVERLILIGLPYFGDREQTYQHFRNGPFLDRWFLTNVTMAAIACMTTRRLFGWLLPYLLPDIPRAVAADLVKHTWRSFTSSLWEIIYNNDLKGDADRLGDDLPVFCIHGDRDQTAPLAGVRWLAQGRPNWQVQVLPGADHHPLLHTPAACLDAMATALAGEKDEG